MNNKYNAISLFSGAMGLDLGIEAAGFDIKVCVEMDHWAAETIRINTSIPVSKAPVLVTTFKKAPKIKINRLISMADWNPKSGANNV